MHRWMMRHSTLLSQHWLAYADQNAFKSCLANRRSASFGRTTERKHTHTRGKTKSGTIQRRAYGVLRFENTISSGDRSGLKRSKRHSLSRCRQEARRFASERTPHARRACTYGPDCERAASCRAADCAREGVGSLLSKPLHMPTRLFQALARAFRGCVRADRAGIPCVQGNALYGRVVQCSSGNGDAHTAGLGAVEGLSRRRAEYRLRCADKKPTCANG